MADIISFEGRRSDAGDESQSQRRIRLMRAEYRRVIEESRPGACDRCGEAISAGEGEDRPIRQVPYSFCDTCAAEYVDFVERLQGRGDPDCYWHNDIWLEIWRRWIDYRSALDRYRRSRELRWMADELEGLTSDE